MDQLETSIRRDMDTIDAKIHNLSEYTEHRIELTEQEAEAAYKEMEDYMDKSYQNTARILGIFETNMHDTQQNMTTQLDGSLDRMHATITKTKKDLEKVHNEIAGIIDLLERHQERILPQTRPIEIQDTQPPQGHQKEDDAPPQGHQQEDDAPPHQHQQEDDAPPHYDHNRYTDRDEDPDHTQSFFRVFNSQRSQHRIQYPK